MNTKPIELVRANVEGNDPNNANRERSQESKCQGVRLHQEIEIMIRIIKTCQMGKVRT